MINKRGAELTTTQIVMIIVLIVSFIVILYFFFRLNPGATSNSQICHNSIVERAIATKVINQPMQCKTDYICISAGGKCGGMTPTTTINVNSNDNNAVMKAIADQMANCWWMFGEGKLDWLGASPTTGNSECGVCSVIGFDSKIPSITYNDFINYLANTPKDNSQTYLQYLYGVASAHDFISNTSGNLQQLYSSGTITTSDQFSIITGKSKYGFFNFAGVFGSGNLLYPTLVKTTDISTYLSGKCGSFITQSS